MSKPKVKKIRLKEGWYRYGTDHSYANSDKTFYIQPTKGGGFNLIERVTK